MKKILMLFATLFALSCGKTGDCTSEVNAFTPKYEAALNKFIADPTEANCNAFKSSLTEYINVIDDCTATTISQAQITQWKKDIQELDCK